MGRTRHFAYWAWISAAALAVVACACNHGAQPTGATVNAYSPAEKPAQARNIISTSDAAPPASQTGGFDGAKAYEEVAKLIEFGPHPPATDAIHAVQKYIHGQLKNFGCIVDEDEFNAQTPIGTLGMKNIVAKIPGTGQGIILLLTHYDTLRLDNFVGADDSGSSTGLMLEMARILCGGQKKANSVWIAFLDGEEAQVVENGQAQWTDTDSVYGSRELAARLAVSGDLKRIKAVILADMIGQKNLVIPREAYSTRWLTDLIWQTAGRLGYQDVFVSRRDAVSDDHNPFLDRKIPAVDLIDYDDYVKLGYWHTTQDTLDKISPRSISITGHVILESVNELQKR
jgi:peptidase M28-like protein